VVSEKGEEVEEEEEGKKWDSECLREKTTKKVQNQQDETQTIDVDKQSGNGTTRES
jgi:hypothetical protein